MSRTMNVALAFLACLAVTIGRSAAAQAQDLSCAQVAHISVVPSGFVIQSGARFRGAACPIRTWSLFLICNPTWLSKDHRGDMATLFDKFQAFSAAIGPTNMAIWLIRRANLSAANPQNDPLDIDADRNEAFCRKFAILPSQTPAVLVTTTFDALKETPNLGGAATSPPGDYAILRLNEMKPSDIEFILGKLTDQLAAEKLDPKELDRAAYWQGWKSAVLGALAATNDYFNDVHVEIGLKGPEVSIGHKK